MSAKLPIFYGPLPVDKINLALALEIDPGDVVFSANAQRHARKRHPVDYDHFLPCLAEIIANPLYCRDDFKNDGKIEIVGMPQSAEQFLLIAITLQQDINGRYHIASFYPVSAQTVANRRQSGHLHRIF